MTNRIYTASTERVWVPNRRHFAHFQHLDKLQRFRGSLQRFNLPVGTPAPSTIDWYKSLAFAMYGNDRLGDCFYAAACHADNTFTGNASVESTFDEATIEKDYLSLSGGDNGLDEATIVGAWKQGLAGVRAANIVDALDIDVTNPVAVRLGLWYFGGVLFTFGVPDDWISGFNTGVVWDAPATVNPNNGHATLWNGVESRGYYRLQTWGSWCWLTPAAVKLVQPAGFVVFSTRWFNAQGYAPNSMHITELADLWQRSGGNAIPQAIIDAYPPIQPTPQPTPPPPPAPTPGPTPPAPVPPDPGPAPTPPFDLWAWFQAFLQTGLGKQLSQWLLELLGWMVTHSPKSALEAQWVVSEFAAMKGIK